MGWKRAGEEEAVKGCWGPDCDTKRKNQAPTSVLPVEAQGSGRLLSIICTSLHLSMPRGPFKWQIKNCSKAVIILALTFNQVYIPALTLTQCVNLSRLVCFPEPIS